MYDPIVDKSSKQSIILKITGKKADFNVGKNYITLRYVIKSNSWQNYILHKYDITLCDYLVFRTTIVVLTLSYTKMLLLGSFTKGQSNCWQDDDQNSQVKDLLYKEKYKDVRFP